MRIAESSHPGNSLPADSNAIVDAPLPAEMPVEVHAGFSLTQLLEVSVKALNRNLENMLKCPAGVPRELQGSPAEILAQYFSSAEFAEQVHAKRIRSLMWTHQMRQSGTVFNHCLETLPMEQRQQLYDEKDRIHDELRQMSVPDEIADEFDLRINSSNEFFDKLLELIDLIKNGYLAGYEHIIAAYSNFFSDFNTEILARMGEYINGANDGKEVRLDAIGLRVLLDSLLAKYSPPNPAAVLFPEPGKGGASREEAESWRKALGLPESCLHQNADGTYCVIIDTGPLASMKKELPNGVVMWDTAKFQAWQTGFNAQEERMKNTLQSFTQKYSNANSYHDNFNKTLSSHLNQYADMLKAMLNF
ncbi:IpaD/SipD/SspD family type III secretion system needle tip protein [Pseudomonas sp. P5_109]|uniref:IpaD/SipD/SspD family type III secretion system needle tip protein n=1 Tax=Pseudomonas sp. P5_109 TaxID=3043441 RepID=UPI002A36FE6C|nr:IpaD/SipD/SspD family type III secretion system needle tip protein [Pseudomonas sp. P5_109]WPN31927.1 IpaD/SipD/SspD family type III secretion system needle tip protein [Pseudomonas sp. P5_109]